MQVEIKTVKLSAIKLNKDTSSLTYCVVMVE
jgi:hypothetical protein